ncbi:MAG: radical SAM protein [Myxococcota bacterium]
MTVEVHLKGVACNISCQYCYQNPMRDAGSPAHDYDVAAIKRAVEATGRPLALFGGEPLLAPKRDLEELFAWSHRRFGRSTIQTNGTLIDDEHLQMFQDYRVNVGVSIDGPGELNDARWAGSLERTRAATRKTEAAVARMCELKIPVSIIITLHRGNAASERLPALLDWVRSLARRGVRRIRLHALEVDSPDVGAKYSLSIAENLDALRAFEALSGELPAEFIDMFHDLTNGLRGADQKMSCVWRACDPYTTAAVQGIHGNGQVSNCGRTNKDGVDFVKAARPGFERYIALYHTPRADHGCQGCRFFLMCKGQCPGTAVDGDWRNRTEHCELWMTLYQGMEERALAAGESPLSTHPRRGEVEAFMLKMWARGSNPLLEQVLMKLDITAGALADRPQS